MRSILWFRRDLRIEDNPILSEVEGEVLPIFIFDKNILSKLDKNDFRISFLVQEVLRLKTQLQSIGLDLYIFFNTPENVFNYLNDNYEFDQVLANIDYDSYAVSRDNNINNIIPLVRKNGCFIINPGTTLKPDNTPYKVFTPFYKSLSFLSESLSMKVYKPNLNLDLIKIDYLSFNPSVENLGFEENFLRDFYKKDVSYRLKKFENKIEDYQDNRDLFYLDGTSCLAMDLRFGTISSKQVFNYFKKLNKPNTEIFIRQLFWREFYNYILFHDRDSETKNWNRIEVEWRNNPEEFQAWCEGKTGVPIVDAAMRHFNNTGEMHNRLRMIVSSFLCKNLLIDWTWGEKYFASKLLDYDCMSNVGSWQWSASTGADAAPYFRIFNPYTQSEKFDKEAIFIKSVIPELKDVESKLIHKEYGLVDDNLYIQPIIDIKKSRERALEAFKKANNQ